MSAKWQKIRSGQRIVVLGLGVSGRAAMKFLLQQGAVVAVSDSRHLPDLPVQDQDVIEAHGIAFEGGGHSVAFCAGCDAVFVSPGIHPDIPILTELQQMGIPVIGELAIAAPYLTETVIGVTGTNGKTTVTALIGELLRTAGKKVFVGGNIGTPLLDYLRKGDQVEYLVLELSSFQLDSAGGFRPNIGVLLNVTPDHLDWHGSMAHYLDAKMKLFQHQGEGDVALFCSDDPLCVKAFAKGSVAETHAFGTESRTSSAYGKDGVVTVTLPGREQMAFQLQGTSLDSHTGMLNSGAALLAALLLGCSQEDIQRGIGNFRLAAHRLQLVRTRNGVAYYNDSKATNTGAVLSGLACFSGNILLIAGGKDKGEEYGVLREALQAKVKELILIGEAADAMERALTSVVPIQRVKTMEEAVRTTAARAQKGDTVLLAPACSSFDMFDNYGQRGEVFMRAVRDLPDSNTSEVH